MASGRHKFGLSQEALLKPTLEEAFSCKFEKTTDVFDPFDFVSHTEKIYIEIKSRHNTKAAYRDTMIGMPKIDASLKKLKEGYEVYFVFNYTDCVSYYRFEEVKPEWIRCSHWRSGKDNYFIPTEKLKDIMRKN